MSSEQNFIVSAINAANRLDFEECFKLLTQARTLAIEHGRRAELGLPSAVGAASAAERAIDFFQKCYEAMKFRVVRNPQFAKEVYKSAHEQAHHLVSEGLEGPLLELVKAQDMLIPILLRLCAAAEHLFAEDFEQARREVAGAERELVVSLARIGIEVDHLENDRYTIALKLTKYPAEHVVALLGISGDFVMTSSIIKLQYCLARHKYEEEMERLHRLKALFDIFELYTQFPSMFRSDVVFMRKLMGICSTFAEATIELVKGGHEAKKSNFSVAYEHVRQARNRLEETLERVARAGIKHPSFSDWVENVKMFLVPHMKSQWESQEAHLAEIAKLEKDLEALRNEQREIVRSLARTGININSTAELTQVIETNVRTNDNALDELKEILRQIESMKAGVDCGEIHKKIDTARSMKNLDEKIKLVNSIIDNMRSIVQNVTKAAPKVGAAFGAIARLFT